MARYDTPVKDWVVRMPGGLNMGKRKYAVRTLQQGVTLFGRKKKNGCRLPSTRQINASLAKNASNEKSLHCGLAFPKINLKNPELTPKVTIVVAKPRVEAEVPTRLTTEPKWSGVARHG